MVIAQHFGLPTRILDWTENPLVALYFSIRENKGTSRDGMLFAYRHGADAVDIESTISPFAISQIELLRPPHLDQRVIAQQSVFTVEPPGLTKEGGGESSDLRYWHVSANHKDEIREQLAKLGISESTLFPGLTSLAEEIKANAIRKNLAEQILGRGPNRANSKQELPAEGIRS
jgi:FRG domain